jgi:hypothetical protein
MPKRANIFDDAAEMDLSVFKPGVSPEPVLDREKLKAISEASNFPSRQAARPVAEPAAKPAPAIQPKREPRRHRTGRTAQFNARTTPETVEAYYAIADRQGWLVGETIERALAALQRELGGQS